MRTLLLLISAVFLMTAPVRAQHDDHDAANKVEGGGISAEGWMGRIDASEAEKGMTLNDARFMAHGDMLMITTGPAVAYWKPENTASGSYTVSATFTEPAFMNVNTHPHPYGIVIGGNDMGTDQQTYLYCATYGTGTFIVRGFGPGPFQLSERRPTAHEAVHKAAEQGASVTQHIAVRVTPGAVSCAINGTEVASYPRSEVVGEGKLKSTDGIYGVRFGHNTEGHVMDLKVVQN